MAMPHPLNRPLVRGQKICFQVLVTTPDCFWALELSFGMWDFPCLPGLLGSSEKRHQLLVNCDFGSITRCRKWDLSLWSKLLVFPFAQNFLEFWLTQLTLDYQVWLRANTLDLVKTPNLILLAAFRRLFMLLDIFGLSVKSAENHPTLGMSTPSSQSSWSSLPGRASLCLQSTRGWVCSASFLS